MIKAKVSSGSGTKLALHGGSTIASQHIEFDYHVGTSGGAMIEPLHAVGKFEEIEKYSKEYKLTDYFDCEPFSLWGLLNGAYRLVTKKPSMYTINNFYKSKEDEKITDLVCEKNNIKHIKYFAPYRLTDSVYEYSTELNHKFFNIGSSYIVES